MAEYIMEFGDALYDEKTGQAVFKPTIKGKLVRCEQCKHYVIHTFFERSQGWCERLCDEFDRSLARGTGPNDYCSYGERREDG